MSQTVIPLQSHAFLSGLPVPTTQQGAIPVSSMQLAVTQEVARHGLGDVENDMQPAAQSVHGDDNELLAQLIRWFESAETDTYRERELARRDRAYCDHDQYTDQELAILRQRGQPPLTINKIKEKVEVLRGLERRGRSDPKAFPRNPNEDARADAATQVLRYLADQNRLDVVRSMVFDNLLVEGVGGCEIIVEQQQLSPASLRNSTALTPQQPDYDVIVNHVPYDRLFWDPHSRHPGFTDARWLGCVIWGDRDQVARDYPGSDSVLEASFGSVSTSNIFDDKPVGATGWCDNRRTRVRVVQIHWKEGNIWWSATFCRGGFLDPPAPSPYLDRHGAPGCPLILRSAYVDQNNARYGVVRGMISMQDELNKRRSKALWRASVRQVRADNGAVDDEDEARRELARPDGFIRTNPGFHFEVMSNSDMTQAEFHLLEHVTAEMNAHGPNQALAGKDPRELSGRAIIANQAGGQVQNEPIADELRQWMHKCYECMWMRVKQFWQAQRWIRVTDDDRNIRFVGLNRPITVGDRLKKMPPDQAHMIAQQMQLQPGDPRLDWPTGDVENDVDDMDVQIVVEEGPDVPTMQAEQFQQIMQLPVQILQQFPPEFIIKASSLRNKDELIGILENHQKQQADSVAQQQAAQHAMQAAQVSKAQAEAQNTAAQAADRQAQTVERMHGIAMDHAHAQHTPIVPGVGPVHPSDNPLMQPAQQQPHPDMQQAQLAQMAADARATEAAAAESRTRAMERLHGMAMDHAQAVNGPMLPDAGAMAGDGALGGPQPPQNALMPQ